MFRQAHPQDWRRRHARSIRLCQGYSPQLAKNHPCPFCKMQVYDRRLHPEQCVILYQVSVQWLRNQTVEDHLQHNNLSQSPKQLL